MKLIIVITAVVYLLGAGAVFWLHTQMPATLGLGLLRSALWPVWVTTGWPHGAMLPMD